jgi:hypothetical protein
MEPNMNGEFCTKMRIFTFDGFCSFSKTRNFSFKNPFKNWSYSSRVPLYTMSCADCMSCRASEIKAQVNRTCNKNPCNLVDGKEQQPGKETRRGPCLVQKAEKTNRSTPFWWMVVKGCFDCGKFDWSMWGYLAPPHHAGEIGGEW